MTEKQKTKVQEILISFSVNAKSMNECVKNIEELLQSPSQPSVDVEALKDKFLAYAGKEMLENRVTIWSTDKIFDFFLPHLTTKPMVTDEPVSSDAVEFADWIVDKAVHRYDRRSLKEDFRHLKEWETNEWCILWTVDNKQFVKTTDDLYKIFKNPPQQFTSDKLNP